MHGVGVGGRCAAPQLKGEGVPGEGQGLRHKFIFGPGTMATIIYLSGRQSRAADTRTRAPFTTTLRGCAHFIDKETETQARLLAPGHSYASWP